MRTSISAVEFPMDQQLAAMEHASIGSIVECSSRMDFPNGLLTKDIAACMLTPDDPGVFPILKKDEINARAVDMLLRIRKHRRNNNKVIE